MFLFSDGNDDFARHFFSRARQYAKGNSSDSTYIGNFQYNFYLLVAIDWLRAGRPMDNAVRSMMMTGAVWFSGGLF
jgi:hypothetical protein